MKLFTIQPINIYNKLLEKGVYTPYKEKSELYSDEYFSKAYDWLFEKMEEKIKGVHTNNAPLWAWYKINGKNHKPDLRCSGYGKKGERYVCLELEISDDKVLLSDFNSWHFVLNNSLLSIADNEEDFDKEYNELYALNEKEQEKLIKKSWDNVFNITPIDNDFCSRGSNIQGNFWQLRIEEVKKVQEFTCR